MLKKNLKKKSIKISIFFIFTILLEVTYIFLIEKTINLKKNEGRESAIVLDGPINDKNSVDISDVKLMLKNIYEGEYKEEKLIFLTFDDGPSKNTEKVLDILREKDVKGTFFVVGKRLTNEENRDKILRMQKEGHSIGNHSYSHEFSIIYKNNQVQVDYFIDEIKKTEKVLEEILGYRDSNNILIRMPGGYGSRKYYKDPNLKELDERFKLENIQNIDWNSLNGDAERKAYSKDGMIEYVKRTSKGKKQIVLLMHDKEGKEKTIEMLPEIIDYFKAEGYSFKRIN
ncbi:MAG: polysaccharide deacetylase family protein [Sarcina sp.]